VGSSSKLSSHDACGLRVLSALQEEKRRGAAYLSIDDAGDLRHLFEQTYSCSDRNIATQLSEKGEALPILANDCKPVFIPSQKLLKAIDPTRARALADVLDEVQILVDKYQAVVN
jgi:hypothetical protein